MCVPVAEPQDSSALAEVTLPAVITPEELATRLGVSKRRVRDAARQSGLCRLVGGRMLLTQSDVDGLLELWKPVPKLPRPVHQPIRLGGGYEELVKFREKQKREAAANPSKK